MISPTRIVTYWLGYPLVIIGFIALMAGILMEAKPERYDTIMGLLILGMVFTMSGAACFFHALLTARKIDNDPD